MSKKNKITPRKDMSREELLERENELSCLEVAYFKKLKAFRENRMPFSKHKPHWSSNLKKKDSYY